MHALLETFQGKLQSFIDDPSSIAPEGSWSATSWYTVQVAEKLKAVDKEAQEMLDKFKALLLEAKESVGELEETLKSVLLQLEETVRRLSKLPREVEGLSGTLKSQEDVAKIDAEGMKKSLDCREISNPLNALSGLKERLGKAASSVTAEVGELVDFLSTLPDRITSSLHAPFGLCFLQNMCASTLPEAIRQLLELVDHMLKLDLEPMHRMLEKTCTTICDLDPEA